MRCFYAHRPIKCCLNRTDQLSGKGDCRVVEAEACAVRSFWTSLLFRKSLLCRSTGLEGRYMAFTEHFYLLLPKGCHPQAHTLSIGLLVAAQQFVQLHSCLFYSNACIGFSGHIDVIVFVNCS